MKLENIKFKAKRLDNQEWVEGNLRTSKSGNAMIIPIEHSGAYPVEPTTVCQFTGMKDCKGREVWEGDVLQDVDDDDIKYVVTFGQGAFFARKVGLYTGIPLHECVGSLGNDVITYAKVVGNKFDK